MYFTVLNSFWLTLMAFCSPDANGSTSETQTNTDLGSFSISSLFQGFKQYSPHPFLLYFQLLLLPLPLLTLIAWFSPQTFLREVLPRIAGLRGRIPGPAARSIWPGPCRKSRITTSVWGANFSCSNRASAWQLASADWLPGPDWG
jgi:hypothetical protein